MNAFFVMLLFLYGLTCNCMEKEADNEFKKRITYLSTLKENELNTKRIKKWGLFEIYINGYGSVKRKTNFQSDNGNAGDNGDFPPAMGSYFTDEYLIKVPTDRWFGEIVCWFKSLVMKQVVKLSLSAKDNFLVTLVRQKYHWDGWADCPLLGLTLVNLQNKNTEDIKLPAEIHSEWVTVDTQELALEYINAGYSFLHYSSDKKYTLTNGKIHVLTISDDGNRIALANNSLIGIMERNNQKWNFRVLKNLAGKKIEELKKDGSEFKTVYWPQKVAFLAFNENGSKLGIGYYAKNPQPLSWRKLMGFCTKDLQPKETEIIPLDE